MIHKCIDQFLRHIGVDIMLYNQQSASGCSRIQSCITVRTDQCQLQGWKSSLDVLFRLPRAVSHASGNEACAVVTFADDGSCNSAIKSSLVVLARSDFGLLRKRNAIAESGNNKQMRSRQ